VIVISLLCLTEGSSATPETFFRRFLFGVYAALRANPKESLDRTGGGDFRLAFEDGFLNDFAAAAVAVLPVNCC